jgi:ABC-type bacteriocin/lantibiotic exporter with double-glycine peptidase domain
MITWYAQEHPSACVAACVRMVLTSFGQYRSESEMRRLLGNPRFGITLRQAAQRLLAVQAVAQ